MNKTIYVGNVWVFYPGMIITMTIDDKPKEYRIIKIEIPSNCITVVPNTFLGTWKIKLKEVLYSILSFPYWLFRPDKAMLWVDRKVYGG